MKALTLPQPLATLVALGSKRLECMPWPTSHRGPLAIHARSRLSEVDRAWCLWGDVHKVLGAAGLADPEVLPLGAVVGIVEVLEARRIGLDGISLLPAWERQLGDYRPGRTVLRFAARPLILQPAIAAVGRVGLWDWTPPPHLVAQLQRGA